MRYISLSKAIRGKPESRQAICNIASACVIAEKDRILGALEEMISIHTGSSSIVITLTP